MSDQLAHQGVGLLAGAEAGEFIMQVVGSLMQFLKAVGKLNAEVAIVQASVQHPLLGCLLELQGEVIHAGDQLQQVPEIVSGL